MSPADRRVIALGNLVGELKSSLEEATSRSGIQLVLTREPAKALVELERASAIAVLVDMATLGAEQFCKRARGTERLRGVPIIGMSRTPSELVAIGQDEESRTLSQAVKWFAERRVLVDGARTIIFR